MPNDRVDAALTLIEAIVGRDDRTRTENDLRKFNLAQVDTSLSIGGFRGPFKSEPETFRRSLVRAVLLTKIAKGTVQLTQAAGNMTTLMAKNTALLERELVSLFPYKAFRGNFEKRRDWAPTHFTTPSRHSDTKYMYMVHTLMASPSKVSEYNMGNTAELENFEKLRLKYLPFAKVDKKNKYKPNLFVDFFAQYLADPNIIRANIISSSVISEAKHATYYPVGFIMEVPPECIYITSPTDVAVANRTTDILHELKTKSDGKGGAILTPLEVLNQTNGLSGDLSYNEVVVVGTAPEGKQVKVTGIFVKTDGRGHLYVYTGTGVAQTEPYVNAKAQKLIMECSKKFNLPIVPIPDTSSQASTTAWPFDDVQKLAVAREGLTMGRGRSGTM